MDDFFEYKNKVGAEITQKDLEDYFERSGRYMLKLINFGRALLKLPLMTQEEYDELTKA